VTPTRLRQMPVDSARVRPSCARGGTEEAIKAFCSECVGYDREAVATCPAFVSVVALPTLAPGRRPPRRPRGADAVTNLATRLRPLPSAPGAAGACAPGQRRAGRSRAVLRVQGPRSRSGATCPASRCPLWAVRPWRSGHGEAWPEARASWVEARNFEPGSSQHRAADGSLPCLRPRGGASVQSEGARHYFASSLITAGVPITRVAQPGAFQPVGDAEVYAHWLRDQETGIADGACPVR
jgi:hypothetical protein